MKRTRAQRDAARRNGSKGGRPKMDPDKRLLDRIRAYKIIDANTEAAAQFLVDLMDGRIPDTTGSDRRLGAMGILDYALGRPATQPTPKETGASTATHRETKVIVRTKHAPPEGWTDENSTPKET